MKLDKIKDKIKVAREAVKGEEEPYKTAAFQVILGKLLDSEQSEVSHSITQLMKPKSSTIDTTKQTTDLEKGKEELAKNCGITVKELDDVLSIKNGTIQIIAPLKGTEPEKQIVVTQCVLATYEIVLGKEWIESSLITKCIDLSGVGGLTNLARTVKNNTNLIRTRGKRPNLEYKLFGPGKVSAFQIIKKLAKGEEIE
ncbi:MAG: hypothetical protein KGI19_08890 [Thaumarchaeota archaeon]|nr:hypothetical protein [Nitrososphaerota archaeon]